MKEVPTNGDKTYTNRLQQMKDIIKLSSIALILIVWTIVSFIAYQNRQLKKKMSQPAPATKIQQKISPTPILKR